VALAFEKIDAQARRDAERHRDRRHRWSRFLPKGWRGKEPAPAGPRPAPTEARVIRTRPPSIKPMGVPEAALAMESSGRDVLVFRDAASQKVSVLYRRRDGDLELIVPEW
jgi:putative sigma-54 modulation protein